MERWEHMQISAGPSDIAHLPAAIQDLGCYGWELVSLVNVSTAPGAPDGLLAILKRPMLPPHDPHDRTEGWKSDPCGRWDARYWDGQTWTFHVERRSNGTAHAGRDAPTMQPVFKRLSAQ
jgi:hypothetical protein